jgi:hypothetical protein
MLQTASDGRPFVQPNAQALGTLTGVPPQTLFKTEQVPPVNVVPAACIVAATRENRFVTLTAPVTAFLIYIGTTGAVSQFNGIALPPGIPYEVSLPGNQALYAVTDAPVFLRVRIQIAGAMAGDIERRLG